MEERWSVSTIFLFKLALHVLFGWRESIVVGKFLSSAREEIRCYLKIPRVFREDKVEDYEYALERKKCK